MFNKVAQTLLCYNPNVVTQSGGSMNKNSSNFFGFYLFLISLLFFVIKVLLVMISYNFVVPRLLSSYSVDMRKYRPITFVESIFLVILLNNLFSKF